MVKVKEKSEAVESKKKGPQASPDNETPHDRFLRLAPKRTDAALSKIKLLGNLSGSGYEWQSSEVQQILDAVFDAVHDMKRKFEHRRQKTSKGFAFASPKQRKEDRTLAAE